MTRTKGMICFAAIILAMGCSNGGGPAEGMDPGIEPGGDPGGNPGGDPGGDPGGNPTPGPGGMPVDTDCTVDMGAGTCAAPIRIGECNSASVTVDTNTGTQIADPAGCASSAAMRNDVVIEFTPPAAGFLTAEVVNAPEGFDSVIFARTACPGAEDTEVGCNDDGGEGLFSKLELENVAAGVPLFLVVQGYGEDDLGAVDVQITLGDGPPPEVAMCDSSGATDVTGNSATVSLDGMGAEHVRVPESCSRSCSANQSGDAVLRYTPERDGTLTISTDNAGTTEGSDTLLAVFSNCAGPMSMAMACDDDTGETIPLSAVVTVPVTGGTPVFVGVDLCRGMRGTEDMPETVTADVEVTFTLE